MILYKIVKKIKEKIYNWECRNQNKELRRKIIKSDGYIGKKTKFGHNVKISGLDNLFLGNNVYIGSNAFIRADGGLTIKDNTTISRDLVLYTVNHDYEGELLPYDSKFIKKPVVIEGNVWIGMNVAIAPGTYIGEGSIIGIGAVVFGNIPKYSIIGSPDWKMIKQRDREHYEKLKKQKLFADDDGFPASS